MKSELAVSESAQALAAELRIVIGALKRRFREQAGIGDLTSAQKSVLLRLERDGPTTGSALARAEAMRPQSMGVIVAALEVGGYVACAPDPADGRQTIISLTDHFRAWARAARAAGQDWLVRSLQARLTALERRQLADAVKLLKRLLDKLALLWHFLFRGFCEEPVTVRASQGWRLCEDVEDGLPDGRHARLWRRSCDSFFSVSLL